MEELLSKLEWINDPRQSWKIKHKMQDIIAIVLFSTLGNCDDWEEIQAFAVHNEEVFREYLELPNGIPSKDTIRRVMGMVDPEALHAFGLQWNELLSTGEGEKLKKIINIDGKTMRDSGNKHQNPWHVVSAWSKEDGICFGQTMVGAKENEIVAIPKLLDTLRINGTVITIDAIGTQTEIAKQIKKQKGDYVLAVKGNQPTLHNDIIDYFDDEDLRSKIRETGGYKRTIEKVRGQIEKREYYQTNDVDWLSGKKKWSALGSIGMVEKTIEKDGKTTKERRYFISSLAPDIELFERAVRGHWAIESMHWHLDVTFREDYNSTLDKQAALNLNIIRKFCLNILKLLDIGRKDASLKLKRKAVSWNPMKYLANAFAL